MTAGCWHHAGPPAATPHPLWVSEATCARSIRVSGKLPGASTKRVAAVRSTPTTTLRHGGPSSMPYPDPMGRQNDGGSTVSPDHHTDCGSVR